MAKYFVKRILQMVPLLIVLSVIVFFLIRLIPGDPVTAMLGPGVVPANIEYERERLGLNDPIWVQYGRFVSGVLKGDLGKSIVTKKPVFYEIGKRLPVTLILAVGGTVISSLLGVLLGVIAAVKHNKFWDNAIMFLSLLTVSTPSFFLALLLVLIFSLQLGWLPSIGLSTPRHAIMPLLTLGSTGVGFMARTTRSAMLDVIRRDYIRTSRSRGIPERVVIYVHALKNALIPVITAIGLRFGGLLAGSALVETVFSIPGMGRFLVDSVSKRDYPCVQAGILVLAAVFIVVNTLVDLLYAAVDPRIRYT
ncbi:MAG: ABC transporter permease [Oscillospiraceae bacterium]|nr:ABC transporter permease [Oscillospiraceae bacterium]